ncbi:MAG: virulence RhuM family protein, partial [Elusimicrobiales bacterium]|nr:virulence RhuM family protein [Elusimicrobiales bacterium]
LDRFLEFMDYGVLKDAGKVSAEIAKLHAETEFEKFRIVQDMEYISDFDRFMLLEEKAQNKPED